MITAAYRILRLNGHDVLLCLVCDRYSAHPDDIEQRYCGYCKLWLADLPATFQRPPHASRRPRWKAQKAL